jgi:hypothetical protein
MMQYKVLSVSAAAFALSFIAFVNPAHAGIERHIYNNSKNAVWNYSVRWGRQGGVTPDIYGGHKGVLQPGESAAYTIHGKGDDEAGWEWLVCLSQAGAGKEACYAVQWEPNPFMNSGFDAGSLYLRHNGATGAIVLNEPADADVILIDGDYGWGEKHTTICGNLVDALAGVDRGLDCE